MEMKKILLLLLLSITSEIVVNAQVNIWLDSKNGRESMSFSFLERDNKQYLQASIDSYYISFPETSQIMIRFFDDSVLQLDGVCIQKDKTREGGLLVKDDVFHSTSEYVIKKEDIERLKIGIQKIRVTTVPNILERIYKKDKAGSKLYELYKKSAF